MEELEQIAESLGVRIVEVANLPETHAGVYLHHRRLILIRRGLRPWTYRSVLAHELGHAVYGDDEHNNLRMERRADQWAAEILISECEYAAAEAIHGPNIGAIAYELGVTPELIEVWQHMHQARINA